MKVLAAVRTNSGTDTIATWKKDHADFGGGKMSKMQKPEGWPNELMVWNNGDSWDGIAVNPHYKPEECIQAWLDDTVAMPCNAREMYSNDCWANVRWDADRGVYSDNNEKEYTVDSLSYLPDDYELDDRQQEADTL